MIKLARKKCDITQKQLANRCNLSQSYLSKLETNENISYNPTVKQIIRISKALKLDAHELAAWFVDKELNSETEFSDEISFNDNEINNLLIFFWRGHNEY